MRTFSFSTRAQLFACLTLLPVFAACSQEVRTYPDAGGGGGSGGQGGAGGSAPTPGAALWSVQIGQNGYDSVASVAVDPAGNTLVIGHFSGAIDLGGGPITSPNGSATFVAKLDRDGKHVWSKAFTLSLPGGQHIAVDPNGEVLVGGNYFYDLDFGGGPLPKTNGGLAVAKLSGLDGSHIWSKGFGDQYSKDLKYVASDRFGGVVILGPYGGTVDFGGGPIGNEFSGGDVFFARLDAAGNQVFTRNINGGQFDDAYGLAVDEQGNIAIAVGFEETISLGQEPATSKGQKDILLAKFDPLGNFLWQKAFGDALYDTASQIAFDAQGNILLTGTFGGSVSFGGEPLVALGTNPNVFLAKFDPDGNHVYSRSLGDGERQEAGSVAVDPAGNALITGSFLGSIDFGGTILTSKGSMPDGQGSVQVGDIFVAKFGPSGDYLWSRQAGDGELQRASGIAVDSGGNVIAGGNFRGTLDFGTGPMTTRGELDGVVAKLQP
ncbi:SBBP repeat-containing protein [Polyangium aurulentum]|uniref:SBBP repeat-containing protein n=1 Tax=Polyangium aurulentum TaxID=2567896 RepID=UPI0010ADE24D|nr:SBBP repeat-containing protein [Polyangium aurulentum]UQA56879.1 hypothetical protein E8A73_037125 [Polyangium aurulentum]